VTRGLAVTRRLKNKFVTRGWHKSTGITITPRDTVNRSEMIARQALERAKMEAREKPYREGLRTSQEGAAFMETRETRAPAQMHDMA